MTRRQLQRALFTMLALLTGLAALQASVHAQAESWEARLRSADPVERARAACELGRRDARDVRPVKGLLLEMLGDDTPVESRLCRDWEGWRGWRQESSPGREAAMALEELGSEVLDDLVDVLERERASARAHAAFALGLVEKERAIDPLIERLDGDDAVVVRRWSAWALGMIESARGVEPLVAALRDPAAEVREQAAWGLGMIESSRAVAGLTGAVDDADAEVREQVAWALGMIEAADGVEPLARLTRDDVADVREQAAWGLGMVESSRGLEPLLPLLRDSEADVREQAAWALGMIEDARAVDALADALERETDDDVRQQLVWALMMVADSAGFDMDPSELAALLRRALLPCEL